MNDEEDEEGLKVNGYDLILLGTGLVNSILSAAASKAGKTVLHLDKNDFYGGDFYNSSNSLSSFIKHYTEATRSTSFSELKEPTLQAVDNIIDFYVHPCLLKGDNSASIDDPHFVDLGTQILEKDREFNIEPNSKILLCGGPTVKYLINSGVSEYAEFRSLDSFLYISPEEGQLRSVPCCKADVFSSPHLSMLEKRSLMKLQGLVGDWSLRNMDPLTGELLEQPESQQRVQVLNDTSLAPDGSLLRPQNKDPGPGPEATALQDTPFEEFLQQTCQLSPQLRAVVLHCLCLRPLPRDGHPAASGLRDLAQLQAGAGRYSAGKLFLLPLFGSADLLQAFCRVSAVWGGVFVLRRTVRSLLFGPAAPQPLEEAPLTAAGPLQHRHLPLWGVRDSTGKALRCGRLVAEASYFPGPGQRGRLLLRAVLLCERDPGGWGASPSLLVLPPSPGLEAAVFLLRTDGSTMACPVDGPVMLLHLRTVLSEQGEGQGIFYRGVKLKI